MDNWLWPLLGPRLPVPVIPAAGSFGVVRRDYRHTGVDLYAPVGTQVEAVEDGVVIRVEPFTGPQIGMPWWLDTNAVLVEGASGVVVYGEVSEFSWVVPGALVHRGAFIAHVKQVLPVDKGNGTSMLHLELLEKGFRGKTSDKWCAEDPVPPKGYMDPTSFLIKAE